MALCQIDVSHCYYLRLTCLRVLSWNSLQTSWTTRRWVPDWSGWPSLASSSLPGCWTTVWSTRRPWHHRYFWFPACQSPCTMTPVLTGTTGTSGSWLQWCPRWSCWSALSRVSAFMSQSDRLSPCCLQSRLWASWTWEFWTRRHLCAIFISYLLVPYIPYCHHCS